MPAPVRAVARGRADPRSDPRFTRVIGRLNTDSRRLKQHVPAAKKAAEPAGAAKGPANEKAAGARAKQVDKLQQAETPKPKPSSFLEMLRAEIAKAMPKTLDDTESFMDGSSSENLKGSLKGNVDKQKQEATGDLKKTSNEAPSESGVPAKPVTPIAPEPAVPAPQVDAAAAMPAPKPDAEVSLQASKTEAQGELEKEKLSDERLKKANDPRFSSALTARDAVNKQADAGPAQYRAKEAGALARSAGQAVDVAKKGAATLLGVKGGNNAKVLSRQQQQKAKEEQELRTFSDFAVATFERTKKAVDERLERLETNVNDLFDRGTQAALDTMKRLVEGRLSAYKADRYSGLFGGARWIKDQFMDLPDEVNRFYEEGSARFKQMMDALAVRVADLVESQLAAAKNEVKTGQALIASKAAALSPGVKARAAEVQAEFAGKFAELETSIDDKKQQLAEGLAQKYKDAFDKADESLKAIQEANKGLVSKLRDTIAAILKALREFRTRLAGVLAKGANAIELILDDPIGFLGNLLAAIKKGFQQFSDNFEKHLETGFIKWLFGALPGLNVEVPGTITLGWIVKLCLTVLGITYDRMREKAVKLLGPTAVTVIEKLVAYIKLLITDPAKLWEQVKEDLSTIKQMAVDAIKDWLTGRIVKAAVIKLASLFNPVGAIIQAIMMIVNVVIFIAERAAQIVEFIETVVMSLVAIAKGNIADAANKIEKSLGNLVPLIIGLLAALLGISGITDKVKEFIHKLQAKVDKAIDKMIAKAVGWVKGIGKKDGKLDERTESQKSADLDRAINEAQALQQKTGITEDEIKKGLVPIKSKYRMVSLELVVDGKDKAKETVHVEGEINPKKKTKNVQINVGDGWPAGVIVGANLWVPEQGKKLAEVAALVPNLITYKIIEGGAGTVQLNLEQFVKRWNSDQIKLGGAESSQQRRERLIAAHGQVVGAAIDNAIAKRGELAKNAGIFSPQQAHHILPIELLERSNRLRLLVAAGWNYNDKINAVALDEGFHGNHPSYNNYVLAQVTAWEGTHGKKPISDFQIWVEKTLIPAVLRPLIIKARASKLTLNQYFATLP